MPKNILIFSDGTGQGGGLTLDERRSNVYKLYRATRSAPDTSISPDKQIAFYDPGLGSSRDTEHIRFGVWRRIYNVLAQAMGLGLTQNIIDCYAFLLRHWEEGDRVYLYGFSRGAYTVRCLGGVMAYCGIPVTDGGEPIFRDPTTARRVAREAVVGVYQHGLGASGNRKDELESQRHELGRNFRLKYGSMDADDESRSNVVPHLVGVWDTVAAVGAGLGLKAIVFTAAFLAYWAAWLLIFGFFSLLSESTFWGLLSWWNFVILSIAGAAMAVILYFVAQVSWATGISAPVWQTIHLRAWKARFHNHELNDRVRYAKHAMSIDENRKDFALVQWTDRKPDPEKKDKAEFEQVWFAGVHSDIGGSYPEDESRLSDIALGWMVERSLSADHPILVDQAYLRIYPDHAGIQHDEIKSGRIKWHPELRKVLIGALHPSVHERFKLKGVVHYDSFGPYQPESLREHCETAAYYDKPAETNTEEPSRRAVAMALLAAAVAITLVITLL